MEIRALELVLTDHDLGPLVARLAKQAEGIEDLSVAFTPEGVTVQGKYPTPFMKVAFETLWVPKAAGPEVHVKLAALKVAGMPGGFLRGALMKMVRDTVEDQVGVTVVDEMVIVSVAELARSHGVELGIHFTDVRLSPGTCVIETRTP